MVIVSKFSNFPDELSENDELREFELSGSDCTKVRNKQDTHICTFVIGGVLDMEFPLSDQPAYGSWQIQANAFVSTTNLLYLPVKKTFEKWSGIMNTLYFNLFLSLQLFNKILDSFTTSL